MLYRLFALMIALPALALAGQRTLFDASATTAADWETGKGMAVSVAEGALTLKVSSEPYSWAAMRSRIAIEAAGQITIAQDPAQMPSKVQVEWFSQAGEFLGVTDIAAAGSTPLSQLITQSGKHPAQMRLKVWLEGNGKPSIFRTLRIDAPLQWREGSVKLIRTYDAAGKLTPDKDFIIAKGTTTISATLAAGTQFAAVVIEDRVAYAPAAVVMLDVAHIEGDFSLQLLCWDQDGGFVKGIDLVRSVTKAGMVEMPISIYVDQIPPRTAKVSFKLWVGGGKMANLQLRGIHYGVKAEAK